LPADPAKESQSLTRPGEGFLFRTETLMLNMLIANELKSKAKKNPPDGHLVFFALR
jgi:hypothetical protein